MKPRFTLGRFEPSLSEKPVEHVRYVIVPCHEMHSGALLACWISGLVIGLFFGWMIGASL